MMDRRRLQPLRADQCGATVVEFAIIAPIMLFLTMGMIEIGYQAYIQSVLQGALNKAGRDAALEDGAMNASTIDAKVQKTVRAIAKSATFTSSRASYSSFSEIGSLEPFADKPVNGVSDGVFDPETECFTDMNNNQVRDQITGRTGQGGADDVVKYTMTARYPLLLPLHGMIGWSEYREVSAVTIMRNQPFGQQETRGTAVCPTP